MLPRGKRATVVALGSINADFEVRVDVEPGGAETLKARDALRLSGGKAANNAYIARQLGCEALLLGRVGDDDLAAQALAPLKQAGVRLDGVLHAEREQTGLSMITVGPSGKKRIVLAPNANDGWREPEIARACRRIDAQQDPGLLSVDCETSPAAAQAAIDRAHARGWPVVLDPSWPERVSKAMLRKTTALTPNVEEAAALSGVDAGTRAGAARAVRELLGEGVALVCLKLGDGGCLMGWGDTLCELPAPALQPVDTTGAGDAFTGALAVALLEQRSSLDAAVFAVAAATLAVQRYGSQPAYAERGDIESLAAELAGTVRSLQA